MKTIISHFGLDTKGLKQKDVDFFNVKLEHDNLAFVDYNRLIKHSSDKLCHLMLDTMRSVLMSLITSSSYGKQNLGLNLLSGIKECNETRLGYSKGKVNGVSLGKVMKPIFLGSLDFLKSINKKNQISLNALRLGIENISYDRISDITISYCLPYLGQYTEEQCKIHNINCNTKKNFKVFNFTQNKWETKSFLLPEFNGKPIVFIPKKLISGKIRALCTLEQFVSFGFREIIQYSSGVQKLKNKKGTVYYKDYEEYLKKIGKTKKQVGRELLSQHNNLLDKFEAPIISNILDLTDDELEGITAHHNT